MRPAAPLPTRSGTRRTRRDFRGGAFEPARMRRSLRPPTRRSTAPTLARRCWLGPLSGQQLQLPRAGLRRGARGSFDAASVHTDIACLVDHPTALPRGGQRRKLHVPGLPLGARGDGGHGDGDKPIWMTELGWTTTTSTCSRGMWAGKKASGVSEAQQAANLARGLPLHVRLPLRGGRDVVHVKDLDTGTDELDHYGLPPATRPRPAWDASAASPRRATRSPAVRRLRRAARHGRARRRQRPLRQALTSGRRHRRHERRPHDLPGRRQGDPQLTGAASPPASPSSSSGRAPSSWRWALTR